MRYTDTRSFALLTRDIRKVDLSTDELKELHITYFKTRSEAIKNRLITYHLRYVITLVNTFKTSKNVTYEDLIGYGSIGLVRALDTFDPNEGNAFTTYSKPCILRQIISSLKHEDIIRMKSTAKTMVDNGLLPTYTYASTSDTMYDSENCTVGDTLSDTTFDGLFDFESLSDIQKETIFWDYMKEVLVRDRHFDLMKAKFSANTTTGQVIKLTDEEISLMFGVTKAAIGQQKNIVIDKLRKNQKLYEWYKNNFMNY